MKKQGKATIIFLFIALMLSCSSTTSSNPTLANQIVGDFIGLFQNPIGPIFDYEITITEVNNSRVKIAPASGSASATFEVDLTSETNGGIDSIILKSDSDIIENNGTFVPSTGRLSYTYHLGGDDDTNLEIFVGDKQ